MSRELRESRKAVVLALTMTALLACSGDRGGDPATPNRPAASESTLVVEARAGVRSTNAPPRMILKTRPALDTTTSPPTLRGEAPFSVEWNLCNSDDSDPGDSLNWQFNFGDSGRPAFNPDGTFNPDFDHFCRVEHTYREGSYTATLSVTDKHLEDQSHSAGVMARNSQQIRVVAFATAPPASPTPAPTTTMPSNPQVSIQNFAFNPAVITIHAGQTVVWVNTDAFPHTVTADSGAFDSSTLVNGATFSQTFSTPGSYPYHCGFHPFMTGTVIVIP